MTTEINQICWRRNLISNLWRKKRTRSTLACLLPHQSGVAISILQHEWLLEEGNVLLKERKA
jgi:hypothetical protein